MTNDELSTAGQPSAVAYLRAADDDRRETLLDYQRSHCRRAAGQLGARLVAEYADLGSSAAPQRPGLDALLARVQEEPAVRYVMVASFDRLTRQSSTLLGIMDTITANGGELVDVHHVQASASRSTPSPTSLLRTLEQVAQYAAAKRKRG